MKKIITLLVFILLLNSVYATQYSYNQKISIKDSSGKEIGYVEPYYQNTLFGSYAFLKWQRYGFPVGNSFPIVLIEGTTTALPFGIQGELLKVKIGKITSSNVDLTIDQSDIVKEIENLDESLPEDIEAITKEVEKQTEPVQKEIDKQVKEAINEIDIFNKQLLERTEKLINKGYYSSLHVVDSSNKKAKEVSLKIRDKETELAEKIGDRVISLALDLFASGSGIIYTSIIKQIPSSIRHDMTSFFYNIGEKYDGDDYSLSKEGVATLYIGDNKLSSSLNSELKSLDLPYISNDKIIGEREYEGSIGIVAAIPEEKVWTSNTLEERWNNDRIRLYKTLINGLDDKGLEAAGKWYNDQLDSAKNLASGLVSLTDGADINDALIYAKDKALENPKSSFSSAVLIQSWILVGLSSLEESSLDKIDSLGYVVVVDSNGNVLEIWTLSGNKKNYFLNEYQEVIGKVEEVSKITGEVVKRVEEIDKKVNIEKEISKKEDNSLFSNMFKTIIGWFK